MSGSIDCSRIATKTFHWYVLTTKHLHIMSENDLEYFTLKSVDSMTFIESDEGQQKIEAIFDKPFRNVLEETYHIVLHETKPNPHDVYKFYTSSILYKLKEPECPYELLTITSGNCGLFHLHCLKKKYISENIE